MKNLNSQIILAVALVAIAGNTSGAVIGGQNGNGGDIYALDFVHTGQEVVGYLSNTGTGDFDLQKLKETVETTKVESTDKVLTLHGLPKDALNFPAEKRIVINRKSWQAMTESQRPAIVLHEYLSIMGIEDANYKYSKNMLIELRGLPSLPKQNRLLAELAKDVRLRRMLQTEQTLHETCNLKPFIETDNTKADGSGDFYATYTCNFVGGEAGEEGQTLIKINGNFGVEEWDKKWHANILHYEIDFQD